jgi:hypothetical protein
MDVKLRASKIVKTEKDGKPTQYKQDITGELDWMKFKFTISTEDQRRLFPMGKAVYVKYSGDSPTGEDEDEEE